MSRNFMFSWHFFYFLLSIYSFILRVCVCILEAIHVHMTDCDSENCDVVKKHIWTTPRGVENK